MDDDIQTAEELDTIYGPGSPIDAARQWLDAVIEDENLEAAWALTDDNLRLCMAQTWVWLNREYPSVISAGSLEKTASRLATHGPADPLWDRFADAVVNNLREWDVDFDTWGFASRPRPLAHDLELLKLIRCGADGMMVDGPTEVLGLQFIVRLGATGWLMAALTAALPVAQWPPHVPID